MADVFLSYSSQDRAAAAQIQAAFQAAGLSVFWDQETPVGQDWNRWIGQKLANSKVCVVLWSTVSVASRNVVHEATIAAERGVLIPAVISPLKPEQFPMGFYTVQGADLTDYRGQAGHPGMAKLIAGVRDALGRPAPATPAIPSATPSGKTSLTIIVSALLGLVVGGAALIGGSQWIMQNFAPPQAGVEEAAAAVDAPAADQLDPASAAVAALEGRWNWEGLACEQGPHITREGDTLVFETPDSRFVHEVGEIGADDLVNTIVLAPAEFMGDAYTLQRSGDQLTVTLVQETPEVNVWTRCGE